MAKSGKNCIKSIWFGFTIFFILSILLLTAVFLSVTGYIFLPVKKTYLSYKKSDKSILYTHISAITSSQPPRNYQNIDSLNKNADYIKNIFGLYCPKTDIQNYRVDGKEYKNIICIFPGSANDKIIVGGHYDVAGYQKGADDNAGGIAGLLELARLIKTNNPVLNNTVELAAYSLEEPPFFRTKNMGSAVHAKSVSESGVKVKGVIVLEMIGYFSDLPGSQKYPVPLMNLFYPDRADFIAVIGNISQSGFVKNIKRKMIEGSDINTVSIAAPQFVQGIDFSDHLNYWKYGYNAVMVTDTSFYRNSNYHTPQDTIETLDFDKMSEVINGVYRTIISL